MKDGNQLSPPYKKSSITESRKRKDTIHATKRKKATWIGHTLCRNCLLKHVIKGNIEGKSRKKT
jgi:hypothetical protein